MKNSGIEWIGEIPDDWEVGPVKYFYTIQTGFTPLTQNEKYYDENGAIWVTIADITQCNKYIVDSKSKISKFYLEQYLPKETPAGSLLYSFKLSIGVTAFAGEPLYTNEAIASFINTESVNLDFLYYSSFLILYNANTNIYGAKLLNQELIKNAPIVFPPMEVQQAIAEYLDKKCAMVERLIENQRGQIEKLKEYKQSVITEAVTKGLDPTVPMKHSGVDWIGDIAESHNIVRLKFLLAKNMTYGANESGDKVSENSVRYIRITDITNDGQLKNNEDNQYLTEEKAIDYILYDKDILFARSGGTVGKTFLYKSVYGKSAFAGYLIQARCNQNKLLPEYLMYYTQSSLYSLWKNMIFIQATIQNIGANKYSNLEIVTSEVNEQKKIVEYLDKKCAEIDRLIAIKQQKIEKLNDYKKSLIYEYVTGKKQVS